MIASLNDVSAFETLTQDDGSPMPLISGDSCSRCIRKGHTYVYDDRSNSVVGLNDKMPKFFAEVEVGETLNGVCCKVDALGTWDCSGTPNQYERDQWWETLTYLGAEAEEAVCSLIP